MTAKPPTPRQVGAFRRACRTLARLTAAGLQVYVAGSGEVHLMTGDSHDGTAGTPHPERSAAQEYVPGMSGGDW